MLLAAEHLESIEATLELARSPNAKIVVIGTASTSPIAPTSVRTISWPICSVVAISARLRWYAVMSSSTVMAEPAYAKTSV